MKHPDLSTHTLTELKNSCSTACARAQNVSEIQQLITIFLGPESTINTFLKQLAQKSPEERRLWGPILNILKKELTEIINSRKQELTQKQTNNPAPPIDVTAYIPGAVWGSLHPYTQITRKLEDIFTSMGYRCAEGPEIETERNNFDALNIPGDHPARDMHDTFWIDIPGLLLRTHTTTIQVRTLETQAPPLALVALGRVYRHEATDASHDIMFMQIEGLLVDKNVSMAELLATIRILFRELFSRNDLELRVRPGYFPFVEPGIEIDISCPFCTGGCSVCKKTGWIEMGGAGLVHPHVLKSCAVDPKNYSGFAFGFGLTRLAMLYYKIPDIRLFTSNKIELLRQFSP